MEMLTMGNEIKSKCQKLAFESAVEFKQEPETKALTGFDITAFTGAVVDRWWGKLAIEIAGIKTKKQLPIFRDHDRSKIVGFSTGTSKDKEFKVSGVFSQKTEHAKEVMELAQEGFPWQASIGVMPKKVLSLEKGAKHTVNGKEITGPGEVWLESEVYETSFVPLGADSNTRVAVFSEIEQGTGQEPAEHGAMVPKESMRLSMDLETLKREHPDLVAAIANEANAGQDEKLAQARQEGADAERQRIQDVRLQLVPGHEALVESLAFDGKTTGPEAAVAVIQAEKKLRGDALAALKEGAAPVVPESNTDNAHAMSDEDKLKASWDKSAELRGEFANDFELFKAYHKPSDGVRIKTIGNKGE